MKKTLKFLEDVNYNGNLAHRKNDIVELDDSWGYATRWLVYGQAVEVIKSTKLDRQEPIKEIQPKVDPVHTELQELQEFLDKPIESPTEVVEEIANEVKIVENKKSKKLKSL